MRPIHFYFPIVLVLCVGAYLIQPVVADDGDAARDISKLESEVSSLKEKLVSLERKIGEEAETRPSVTLRLRALELSVEQIEREQGDDDAGDGGADRDVRDLTRRLRDVEATVDQLGRKDIDGLERQIDAIEREVRNLDGLERQVQANERAIRSLETRVRRVE